ncbi:MULTISPECIES: hypothetical protein [Kamptonema]|uniref:hypothetical protein n=1 Tax=Kamptonema TaxID=1501433 RepID=UPI0001DAD6D2|nr:MULTISPECIES: hypothetical protein [Kamptonema]CBN58949.1 conserved exported hypothetical protein [Kamptonema sp. PCC 6506]
MNTNISPILKIFSLSAALSLTIKYGGPSLSVPSSNAIALIAILTPSIILAALLGWRALKPVKSS